MTALENYQFEILPNERVGSGFVFGLGADVSVNDGGWDPGEATWLSQDTQNSRRGVTGFGRDVLAGKTWVWEAHVDQEDIEGAIDTLDDFSAAWAPDDTVREPGALAVVRYRLANRIRRVYGRPRRYAAPPTNLIESGYVPVTVDFATVDAYTYDDAESSAQISYASGASLGGFILPQTMPLSSLPTDGNGGGQLSVGGTARAYPIVRFNGPWTNPVFSTDNWTLSWTGVIPTGGWVEIDCRPWALTVLNQSGASVAGGLAKQTWLEDCWFAPKSQPQINLRGSAPGGGASALVRWRNTWTSI